MIFLSVCAHLLFFICGDSVNVKMLHKVILKRCHHFAQDMTQQLQNSQFLQRHSKHYSIQQKVYILNSPAPTAVYSTRNKQVNFIYIISAFCSTDTPTTSVYTRYHLFRLNQDLLVSNQEASSFSVKSMCTDPITGLCSVIWTSGTMIWWQCFSIGAVKSCRPSSNIWTWVNQELSFSLRLVRDVVSRWSLK